MKDRKKIKTNSSSYTAGNFSPGDHTREKGKKNKFTELRRKAEDALKNTCPHFEAQDPAELSLQEIRELIHELNVYQVELETQNDELIKLYCDLEVERNKYYDLYDLAPVGYFTIDREGTVSEINLTGASLLGLGRSGVMGKPFHHFITFDSQDIYYLKRQQVLRTGVQQSIELKIKKADNSEFHAQLQFRPLCDLEGKITHIRGVIIDINRLMLAEAQLKNSLREKALLLKELHHRVKNNLSLVSNLLYLQEETVRDPTVDRVFESSRDRIKSMALVHEILYNSEDLAKVDFSQYIKELLNYLSYSYVTGKTRPNLKIRIGDIKIPINKAIPCGLVINELVTNSFKYAFPGDRAGEIRIELAIETDKSCRLLIGDNGVGLPADLDMANLKSFGLTLVSLLITQLKGSFEIDRSGGTTFIITIPLR